MNIEHPTSNVGRLEHLTREIVEIAADPARGYYLIIDGEGRPRRMRTPARIRFERLARDMGLIEDIPTFEAVAG